MMEHLTPVESIVTPELLPVEGGHMFYQKCIVRSENEAVFIKAFDPDMFSNADAREHTLTLLRKEGEVYLALYEAGFRHLPDKVFFQDDVLYMTACLPEQGWCWELPETTEFQKRYVRDILKAFRDLEALPAYILPANEHPSMQEIYDEGWQKLKDLETRQQVITRLEEFSCDFHPHVQKGVGLLRRMLTDAYRQYEEIGSSFLLQPTTGIGHFDARQTNIAWHPEHGVSIVDWSWASPAPPKSDTTMFLIDLFKSGYDDVCDLAVTNFDPGHALLQIGHWMARSTLPGHNGDTTIRFHQLASAASAATLLIS